MTAVLYDDDLAVESLDEREGLGQYLGPLHVGECCHPIISGAVIRVDLDVIVGQVASPGGCLSVTVVELQEDLHLLL